MNIWGVMSEIWALHCLLWKLLIVLIVSRVICKVVEIVVLILIELVGCREELGMLRVVGVR